MFDLDFPTETTDIKFRAVQWILTEVMLALAAIWNLLPRQWTHFVLPTLHALTFSSKILQMDLLFVQLLRCA